MNKWTTTISLAFALILTPAPFPSAFAEIKESTKQQRPIIGWTEKIKVYPGGLVLHAEFETGTAQSSIHADKIKEFKKKDKPWVKFVLHDRYGKEAKLEREVLRMAKLKNARGETRKVPVVEFGLCIGSWYMEDEISLLDRSTLDHDLRIGRQTIEGNFVVDPALTFTLQPECKKPGQ